MRSPPRSSTSAAGLRCARAPPRRRARRVVDAAGRVGDRDDFRAELGREPREGAPTLPKPCTATLKALERPSPSARSARRAEHDAAAGRLAATQRAADRERLAGDDAGHGVAVVHGVRVDDPGHHLRARAHVGRRDVRLRADIVHDLVVKRRVIRSSSLGRDRLRVAATPPLAPPNGMSISAHFQVIHIARAFTSSR